MAKTLLKCLSIFLGNFLEDFLILIGLIFIVYTTFSINFVAGMYLTGLIFIILGVFLAKKPPERG
jgi:hypothetical protein